MKSDGFDDQEILFEEKQRFGAGWGFFVGCMIALSLTIGIVQGFGKGFFIVLFASGICFVTLVLSRLETRITSNGIYVRFFPFHISFKHYPPGTISQAFIRKYSPIGEYGGWGIRIGIFGNGKAYNTSGNVGIQLILMSGRKLLIGTNKPEEAEDVLEKLGYSTEQIPF